MKKCATILTILILTLSLWAGSAFAYTITDDYWGADDHGKGDVIGEPGIFDIYSMEVTLAGDELTVRINTKFAGKAGIYDWATAPGTEGIGYGDLFLASMWDPYGSAADHYAADKYSNGTSWDYAFSLDNRWSNTGGSFKIYELNSDSILLSENFMRHGTYRNGQEVALVLSEEREAAGTGTWGIVDIDNGYIEFKANIANTSLLDGPEIALHWGPTCANDVIEGSAPIPEPDTMLLLGFGLISLVGLGSKRLLKRNQREEDKG